MMFFTYLLIDPKNNQPFYVGKGSGNRHEYHIKEAKKEKYGKRANRHKINIIRAILNKGFEVIIKKIAAPDEKHAFEMEELLIAMLGRKDNKTGILTNMTNGGEGVVGKDHTGVKNPNYGNTGIKSIWFGKKHTEETKQKMSMAQKGRVMTEEHKANMRKPKSVAVLRFKTNCPHCDKTGESRAMLRWHFDNCKNKGEV
jgi:hypothetical protein